MTKLAYLRLPTHPSGSLVSTRKGVLKMAHTVTRRICAFRSTGRLPMEWNKEWAVPITVFGAQLTGLMSRCRQGVAMLQCGKLRKGVLPMTGLYPSPLRFPIFLKPRTPGQVCRTLKGPSLRRLSNTRRPVVYVVSRLAEETVTRLLWLKKLTPKFPTFTRVQRSTIRLMVGETLFFFARPC